MSLLRESDFHEVFLRQDSWLDVRAPVEFSAGSIPGAVNVPILNDREREEIGTLYKREGSHAAIARGHELVSGETKSERVDSWLAHLAKAPGTLLYCFRGGLRSQTAQTWIREAGLDVPIVEGGYKALRRYLRRVIEEESKNLQLVVVAGRTGAGKTEFLRQGPHIDLEKLANHRGSAFGSYKSAQPTQVNFENQLALQILRRPNGPIYIEDESRMIGKVSLPDSLYRKMQESPVYELNVSLEERVDRIYREYILQSPLGLENDAGHFQVLEQAIHSISRKLGGARAAEVLLDLRFAEGEFRSGRGLDANRTWIEKILSWYYDPLYANSARRKKPT